MTERRCPWAESSPAMGEYHDREWGVPSRDDRHLFEFLVLESAQAGLSWSTILAKRERYREVLDNFDAAAIARYRDEKLDSLMADAGIVRNRRKIDSLVPNAQAFLRTREEYGAFAPYLWDWVDDEPVVTAIPGGESIPARSELSDALSKDLKRRGFRFLGSTTLYAYLQAVGIVNDHIAGCPAGARILTSARVDHR